MMTFKEGFRMKVAVIIPCYKVTKSVLRVIKEVGSEVDVIFVVDDCCPDGSGSHVEVFCKDNRVVVIRHAINQGVGGAVISGYIAALEAGCDVMVKLDGDGQMDPSLIKTFITPIARGDADC